MNKKIITAMLTSCTAAVCAAAQSEKPLAQSAAVRFSYAADSGRAVSTKPPTPLDPPRTYMTFDHPTQLYAVGEKAVIDVKIAYFGSHKESREGTVEIWADDGWTNTVWRRTVDLSKEKQPIRMELSRSTPGSIRIHTRGKGIRGGFDRAIFDWDKIMPLTDRPDDFESYWKKEMVRLDREAPFEAEKIPAPDLDTEDHNAFRVSFPTFDGGRIYGLLAVPKGEGPFPVIVNVPGAGAGDRTFRKELVRKGWITLMMNIHGFPIDGTRTEYRQRYDKWFKSFVTDAGEKRYQFVGYAQGVEKTLYHKTILGMTRGIEWLSKEKYADSNRFVYYGCSQGGGFGMYLTAMWGKFARTFVMCPNKCDTCAHLKGRQPGSSHVMDQKKENLAAAEKNAPYIDNCNFARMIKTPFRLTVGTADDNCQTIGIIAAYNTVASKDKAIKIIPKKGHGWHKEGFDEWLFELERQGASQE